MDQFDDRARHTRPAIPRFTRLQALPGAAHPDTEPAPKPANPRALERLEFARRVALKLLTCPRVAVVDCGGRPAYVDVRDRLYARLALDHDIVGIYTPAGASVRDIMADLEAAGL